MASFEIQKINSRKQIVELDNKTNENLKNEAITSLEDSNFDLNPEAKVNIILASEGIKPATNFIVKIEDSEKTAQIINNLGLHFVTSSGEIYNQETGRNSDAVKYILSSDKDVIEKLKNIHQEPTSYLAEMDNLESKKKKEYLGNTYGYPKTAVDAFVNGEEKMEIKDIPEETRNSEIGQFLQRLPLFRQSKAHWREELEIYTTWVNKIKEISPRLYKQILEMPPTFKPTNQNTDVKHYLRQYLELNEDSAEKIKVLKTKDLPQNYQAQRQTFNDKRLDDVNIAIIPDDLWVKGSQPSESDAENNLILIKQSYFETRENPDEIAWMVHELAHCQNFMNSKNKADYQKKMGTIAFEGLKMEYSYPNNLVEQETFTKQFQFLKEQGREREDIIKMVSEYYHEEDFPFFDKLLNNIYSQ